MATDNRALTVQEAGVPIRINKRAADLFKFSTDLAPHLLGTGWLHSSTPTSIPPGSFHADGDNVLTDVSAVDATHIFAVGTYGVENERKRTLAQFYDGTNWTTLTTPNPSPNDNVLNSVHAISATNAWACGYYTIGNVRQPLIIHYDGSTWSQVATPTIPTTHTAFDFSRNPTVGVIIGSWLNKVHAADATHVAFAGAYTESTRSINPYVSSPLVFTCDGLNVTLATGLPAVASTLYYELYGVSYYSSGGNTELWVVGQALVTPPLKVSVAATTPTPVIYRYNGTSWSDQVGTGLQANLIPTAVIAFDPTHVYVFGYVSGSAGIQYSSLWGNPNWTNTALTVNGTFNNLQDVSGLAPTDIWAVGTSTSGGQTVPYASHYNGTTWATSLPTPQAGARSATVAVTMIDTNTIYAVGDTNNLTPKQSRNYAVKTSNAGTNWAVTGNPPNQINDSTTAPTVTIAATPGSGHPTLMDITIAGGQAWVGWFAAPVYEAFPHAPDSLSAAAGSPYYKLQRYNVRILSDTFIQSGAPFIPDNGGGDSSIGGDFLPARPMGGGTDLLGTPSPSES